LGEYHSFPQPPGEDVVTWTTAQLNVTRRLTRAHWRGAPRRGAAHPRGGVRRAGDVGPRGSPGRPVTRMPSDGWRGEACFHLHTSVFGSKPPRGYFTIPVVPISLSDTKVRDQAGSATRPTGQPQSTNCPSHGTSNQPTNRSQNNWDPANRVAVLLGGNWWCNVGVCWLTTSPFHPRPFSLSKSLRGLGFMKE